MKAKKFIALFALSFGLGAGVFAGLSKAKAIKADAAPVSTIYCKMSQSWWTVDDAAVGAYCWNSEDESQTNDAWPGVRMSKVAGETDLWTYSVPNGYDKVIFTRVNGSGDIKDWGAKTADLDIPSKKNCYTITSESAVWGDPGVAGYWSVYPEVAPEYHLLGTFNSWNDPDDDYLFVVDGEDSNHYTLSDVELTTTDEFKVADSKNDDWFDNGSGNITVNEAGTYDIDFYVTSENPTHVVLNKQVAAPEYHLLGTFNEWTDSKDDYLFVVDGSDSNHYTLNDVDLTKDDEFKVSDTVNGTWYDNGDGNIVVSETGTYDFDFYVVSENPTHIVFNKQVVEPTYTVSGRFIDEVTFELDEDDKPEGVLHQYSATIGGAHRARQLHFYANGTEITSNISADAGDSEHINNIYGDTTNGFRVRHNAGGGQLKIYLKTYAGGGISLWGEGYAHENFYVTLRDTSGGTQNLTLSLDTTYEANESYIQQYKTTNPVSIKAEDGEDWETSFSFSDNAGYTQDFVPEDVVGNNAMTGFQSTAYHVHNDCLETIYVKLRTTDLAGMLYIGGYRDAHQITIGGNTITLDNYKSDTNEYYATGVSLSAGDTVTAYTVNGDAVEGVAAAAVANNNLNKAMKVVATTASANIYYNVSAKTLWISGIPNGGFAVYKNSSSVVTMVETDPFGEYTQWKTESTSFAAGDTIQIMDCGTYDNTNGGPVIWSITKINEGGNGDKFEVDGGVIKCKTACSTSVYLKLLTDNDEIYFGSVAEYIEDAINYVNGFKSAMSTACSASIGTKQATVEAAWANQATEFAKLTKEAKDEVKLGGYSSVAEIKEFASRYISIIEQHGSWTLSNFLEWDVNPSSGSNYIASGLGESSSAVAIISIISLVSITSITVLLTLKKRRHI